MTPKQQRFVEEYLIDLNATQAAIRAGYSARTANEQGARLLANVSVRSAIADAKTKRSEETQVNAAWLLARLAQESVADLADLYDERGNVKPVKDWPLIWRQGLVAGIEVETIGAGAGIVTKLKISDRIKRLELIGKHIDVQAFKEKLEVAGAMTLIINQEDAEL
ncbi:terminase small subunit [Sphingobium fuliginis]|uniref:Terminase small subunit n=1 Tax=Sphingobium fuliginis ATCC 27551 TaxID=1208342 RepID=A0A5B8CDZ5_SPHSA|nr:terminase small subunit [Sphingobium fuliginis]QDC37085.1 terminase small subunit [Sphingobium fuliginis ATCC 27551]